MKKIKLLTPILFSSVLPVIVAPAITSCSNPQIESLITLEQVKALSKGKIINQANDAMARQPEVASKVKTACLIALHYTDLATDYAQALGFGYNAQCMDAMARQPEMISKLQTTLIAVCQLMLSQPNENGLALGYGAGGLYDAMARQPEMANKLCGDYLDFAFELIDNQKNS